MDVVHAICELLDELHPASKAHRSLTEFVPDRASHDFRYAIDRTKTEREIGWKASI